MNTITKSKKTFSTSVNINRDNDTVLNYIPTPNSQQAFLQISNNYRIGIKSFNLVGAYGVGKSAFLVALESDIKKGTNFFNVEFLYERAKKFEVYRLIGNYDSLQTDFANLFFKKNSVNISSRSIIEALDQKYKKLQIENKGLVIFIDEFGKYLEYAATTNPENEIYFIQELAEYINDPDKDIILVSTLHQDFNRYSDSLTRTQQNEWNKVKGRLKEVTFNEPVEQLLFLAARRTNQLIPDFQNSNSKALYKTIIDSKLFPLKDYFSQEIAEELQPFDLLSAAVLTRALQKYGQNERSLFSFMEANDPYSLFDFDANVNPFYNLCCVYDYLIHNFYSYLTSRFNSNFSQWATIRAAIERVEGLLPEKQVSKGVKVIKTIGLLSMFASASGKIDKNFIEKYSEYAMGIFNSEEIIANLVKFKIVRFVSYANRYSIAHGTDLDLEKAISEAALTVNIPNDIANYLKNYFLQGYVSAKATYYRTGTPRYFGYQFTQAPSIEVPEGELDGFIQLIFSDFYTENDIKKISEECKEAILFVLYKDTKKIKETLLEIFKIDKVILDNSDDKIAVNELNDIKIHHQNYLNKLVLHGMYDSENVKWYYKGELQTIDNSKSLNKKLSNICEEVYFGTPIFRNEMANRTRHSSPINTARKNFIKNLSQNWRIENLGYQGDNFPPDRTIYLSLLKNTGIHKELLSNNILEKPSDESFLNLWDVSELFIKSTKHSERNLQDFVDILLSKPFKLKKGLIDFWLPIFLFINRDEFAIYNNSIYIQEINSANLDLIVKSPKNYHIKAFDVDGIKLQMFNRYRKLLEQTEKDTITNNSFIEIVKPFLSFYKDLNDYAKITTRLSTKAIALRKAISNAKDPEKTFFENFPSALGYNLVELQKGDVILERYMNDLQFSIKELREAYPSLISRVEGFIKEEIIGKDVEFNSYRIILQDRFSKIRVNLLKPNQKIFFQRLMSEIDDKPIWINSLVQACIGKNLHQINDEEEAKLYDFMIRIISELDNLSELVNTEYDFNTEEVFKIEITSIVEGLSKQLVRFPKSKTLEIEEKEIELRSLLGKDSRINIAILTSLLQKELKYEKS